MKEQTFSGGREKWMRRIPLNTVDMMALSRISSHFWHTRCLWRSGRRQEPALWILNASETSCKARQLHSQHSSLSHLPEVFSNKTLVGNYNGIAQRLLLQAGCESRPS